MSQRKSQNSFSCSICSDKFVSSALLVVHTLTCSSQMTVYEQTFQGVAGSVSSPEKLSRNSSKVIKATAEVNSPEKVLSRSSTKMPGQPSQDLPKCVVVHAGLGNRVTYQCTVCNKYFKTKAHSKYHDFCQAPGKPKPFKCSICCREFISRCHFEYHERSHTGEKPFSCNICAKSFINISKLNRHVHQVHEPPTTYTCNICGQLFLTCESLHSHRKMHSNYKPFTCEVCNKAFTTLPYMKKHEATHNNGKSFLCEICGCTFKTSAGLNAHKTYHAETRDFVCSHSYCSASFKNKKDVQRHLKFKHSDSQLHACKVCDKRFKIVQNLRRHVKKAHPKAEAVPVTFVCTNSVQVQVLESPSISTDFLPFRIESTFTL